MTQPNGNGQLRMILSQLPVMLTLVAATAAVTTFVVSHTADGAIHQQPEQKAALTSQIVQTATGPISVQLDDIKRRLDQIERRLESIDHKE